jgi:1,4-alpha-glucan branching enzyme
VLLNLTPVPRPDYRTGAPAPGRYAMVLSSDDPKYGGSGYGLAGELHTEPVKWQHQPDSLRVSLPPLGAVLLAHRAR